MYLILTWTLAALAAALALRGMALIARQRFAQERIQDWLLSTETVEAQLVDEFLDRRNQSRAQQILRPATDMVRAFVPEATRQKVRAKLQGAGVLHRIGEAEFILMQVFSVMVGFGGGIALYRALAERAPLQALMSLAIAIVVGVLLPDYWLQMQVNARQYTVRKQLPDVLDLLVVSVEAGTGFDAAIQYVEQKFPGPLAEELGRALQEMQLGKPRAEALRGMAERTGVTEVSTFVSAICLADQLGVSMAQVLKTQADTLRQKRLYMIREIAHKLPVKMLFPLVFCIFPAVFVVLIGSGVVRIFESMIK